MEIFRESCTQILWIALLQNGKAPKTLYFSDLRDRSLAVGHLVAYENDPKNINAARAQSFYGKKAVIDRAKLGSCAKDCGDGPMREKIGLQ